jgi:hypothetical protein
VPLLNETGQPLPQTDEVPNVESASFKKRVAVLFQAIVDDRTDTADAAFFPVIAYEQVKAIEKPARDHKYRLLAAFHRTIHEYHRKVASVPGPVQFISFEPGTQPARWMKPGDEGNKLGYYRVLRTFLKYADANGKQYRLGITSMISWRGEWYVVHLDGFK